eukprot:3426392-Amphidinium_carterae.1
MATDNPRGDIVTLKNEPGEPSLRTAGSNGSRPIKAVKRLKKGGSLLKTSLVMRKLTSLPT